MVEPQQMEGSVDEKLGHFVVESPATRPRLARGGLDPDDDVAQQRASVFGVVSLEKRKGQHIRSTRLPALGRVEGRNRLVIDQVDREFGFRMRHRAQ